MGKRIKRFFFSSVKFDHHNYYYQRQDDKKIFHRYLSCSCQCGNNVGCSSCNHPGDHLSPDTGILYHQIILILASGKHHQAGNEKRNRVKPESTQYKYHYPSAGYSPSEEIIQAESVCLFLIFWFLLLLFLNFFSFLLFFCLLQQFCFSLSEDLFQVFAENDLFFKQQFSKFDKPFHIVFKYTLCSLVRFINNILHLLVNYLSSFLTVRFCESKI